MTNLPTPPDAYWTQIPWWAYIGFLIVSLLIVVVIGPWMIQRARNQPSAILSREQTLKIREDAFQARQERELVETAVDRDRGWNIARGWAAVSHKLWHDQNNTVQLYNSLLTLCGRVADGKVTGASLRDRLIELRPLPGPPALPDVEAVEPKNPSETKYA